jgi:folate-binding protein YgfZ
MTGPGKARKERIADLSRTRLRVSGADRVAFLQGQCTNDVNKLAVGQGCYAAFLNAKGKMRGEGHIICLPDAFLLETSEGLRPSLEKFVITEDVVIEDVSATLGEWLIAGSAPVPLPADAVTFLHPLGTGVISATPLVPTLSVEELEMLRMEAAVPLWGVDMDENTIPNEAGLEGCAISYDKGCYIGQETIARIKTYGHVNRHLVQLKLAGGAVPARGTRILAGDKEVGTVTSAVRSARFAAPVALGYVRRELAKAGAIVTVGGNQAEVIRLCGS